MTEGTPDSRTDGGGSHRPLRIAAVVAAAGFSSRMGSFKPLLRFAGTTVVGRVVGVLRAAGVDEIVVVVGHRAEELAPQVLALGARPVVNPDFARGMFTSLAVGIRALSADVDAAMILPVDVPSVRITTLKRIVAAVRRARPPRPLVHHPSVLGMRGHPPVVDRALFAEIVSGDGAGGLAALLARHADRAAEIPVIDRGILLDMDRPLDHTRLSARVDRLHVPEALECDAVFARLGVDERIRRHGWAVAGVAEAIAERLVAVGVALDRDLIVAAAALHDVAKGRPAHAEVAGRWLRLNGFPEVGRVVAGHMRLAFAPGDRVDERVVVHLADKLVREAGAVTLAERFAAIETRFADDPVALAGARERRRAAEAMAAAVERAAPGVLAAAIATIAGDTER